MTQQTTNSSVLTHSRSLLTKCLQAALIAAPVLLAAAPSEAVSVKTTVNGFTGEFAPANWTRVFGASGTGNTSTVTPTTITLSKRASNSTPITVSAGIALSDTLFNALRPSGAGRLLSWTATGNYDWSIVTAPNTKFDFTASSNADSETLNTSSSITDGSFTAGDSYALTPFDPSVGDELTFAVRRIGNSVTGSGTGVIDNFQFIAEYDVPGPLPVVGAAAAFAWSRRLRNRLKSAKTLA